MRRLLSFILVLARYFLDRAADRRAFHSVNTLEETPVKQDIEGILPTVVLK